MFSKQLNPLYAEGVDGKSKISFCPISSSGEQEIRSLALTFLQLLPALSIFSLKKKSSPVIGGPTPLLLQHFQLCQLQGPCRRHFILQ